jgi:hypothetical protein
MSDKQIRHVSRVPKHESGIGMRNGNYRYNLGSVAELDDMIKVGKAKIDRRVGGKTKWLLVGFG